MASNTRPITAADLDALGRAPLFSALTREERGRLLGRGSVRGFSAPTLLFSSGDPADCFYAVLTGAVHLFALTAEGDEGVVTFIGPEETFAEAAMFGLGMFPVNAEAQPGTELVRIERGPFEALLREDPRLGLRMLDALLGRQVFLMEEIVRLKAQSPCQRLASYLLSLAETTEWQGRGRLPFRKQLIASRIGIEPESLSRALRRLTAAGVACPGDDVVIEDLDRLRDYCAEFGLIGGTSGGVCLL